MWNLGPQLELSGAIYVLHQTGMVIWKTPPSKLVVSKVFPFYTYRYICFDDHHSSTQDPKAELRHIYLVILAHATS
jgi:hypothetical protein